MRGMVRGFLVPGYRDECPTSSSAAVRSWTDRHRCAPRAGEPGSSPADAAAGGIGDSVGRGCGRALQRVVEIMASTVYRSS